jgi:hypothetical protein
MLFSEPKHRSSLVTSPDRAVTKMRPPETKLPMHLRRHVDVPPPTGPGTVSLHRSSCRRNCASCTSSPGVPVSHPAKTDRRSRLPPPGSVFLSLLAPSWRKLRQKCRPHSGWRGRPWPSVRGQWLASRWIPLGRFVGRHPSTVPGAAERRNGGVRCDLRI